MEAVNIWGQLPSNDEILRASVNRARVNQAATVADTPARPAAASSTRFLWVGTGLALLALGWALFPVDLTGVMHAVSGFLPKQTTTASAATNPSAKPGLRELESRVTIAAAPGEVVVVKATAKPITSPEPVVAAPEPIKPSAPAQETIRTPPAPVRSVAVRAKPIAQPAAKPSAQPIASPIARVWAPVRDKLPPPASLQADVNQAIGPTSELKFKRIDPLSVNSKEAAAISPLFPN